MSAFNRFPSQAFIQWDTISEIIDVKGNFWKVAADGFFPVAGKEYEPENGENWILVPVVTAEGVGTRRPFAAGDADITIPFQLFSGTSGGSGNAALFAVQAAGVSGAGGSTSAGSNGNVQLFFTAEGSGHTNEIGVGDVVIPYLTINGSQPGIGSVLVFTVGVTGFGYSGQQGNGEIVIPFILTAGTNAGNKINNSVKLSMLHATGAGSGVGAIGASNVIIPLTVVRGTGSAEDTVVYSDDVILRNERRRRFI